MICPSRAAPLAALLILAASASPSPAAAEPFVYEPLGWSFDIPPGWRPMDDETIDEVRSTGQQALVAAENQFIPLTTVPVLYLESDGGFFTADVDSYSPSAGQTFEDYRAVTQASTVNAIRHAVRRQGITVQSSTSMLRIDGVQFGVLQVRMMSGDSKSAMVESVMFDALIGETVFAISYSCFDPDGCIAIRSAISQSTFED